jgi:hypothetical protein
VVWSRGRAGLALGLLRARRLPLEAGLAASLELDDLRRALVLGPLGLDCPDEVQMAVHLVLLSVMWAPVGALSQRAPRAKSEISCGVAVSKPTTSSIPGSAGSAIEKPFETIPTTTSRASMPDASR